MEGLQKTIKWEKYGYKIVGTAINAYIGFEKIKELKPDVVITDIRMRQMNGLELIKRVKELDEFRELKFVILSAYSDFNYAKKACEYGVYSYLLKPMEEDEIKKVMIELRDNIIREKNKKKQIGHMSNIINEHFIELRQSFIKSILLNKITIEEIERKIKLLNINFNNQKSFLVSLVRIDEIDETIWNKNDIEIYLFAVENIIGDEFKDEFNIINLHIDHENIAFIFWSKSGNEINEMKIEELLNRSIYNIKHYLNVTISISKGRVGTGYVGMKESYDDAYKAMEMSYILGVNKLFDISSNSINIKSIDKYPVTFESKIFNSILRKDMESFKEDLNEFISYLTNQGYYYAYINICLQYLFSSIIKKFMEMGYDFFDKYGEIVQFLSKMHKQPLETMKEKIISYTEDFISQNNDNWNIKKFSDNTIHTALKFINKNIDKTDLSIKTVAQEVYLNSVYFGRVFKNEMGKSFNQYITELRLDMAKDLLDHTSLKINEIALKVGIDNLSYFNVLFKKNFGLAPKKYRNRCGDR